MSAPPREIAPGLYHWTALHRGINSRVSSYYIESAASVVDPIEPEDGWSALPARPEQILLTSGHHGRDAGPLSEQLGIPVRASREAAAHLGDQLAITIAEAGEEIAPGVRVLPVGVLCPDEGALLINAGGGALALADGLTTRSGQLGFFPDRLLGDDPEAVKQGLSDRYRELLDEDFEHLLTAHGDPIVGEGKHALEAFLREFA